MRNLRSAQLLENLGNEYYLLASLYEESAKYDKALDLYQKARTAGSSKTDRELTFKIARSAALAKDWDAALKEYESLLKTDSGNLLVQKSVAWIYGQKGDFNKAEQAYAALYKAHPYDKDICNTCAASCAFRCRFKNDSIIGARCARFCAIIDLSQYFILQISVHYF